MNWLSTRAHLSVLIFCILAIVSGPTLAQTQKQIVSTDKLEQINAMIEERALAASVPGLSIAITQNGKTIYASNLGQENEAGDPITAQTSFALASVSKSFVGVLILQLVEQDRIDLDQSAITYLPGFRSKDKSRSDNITVRHLLNQTSGLSGYVGNLDQQDTSRRPDALQMSVAQLANYELVSQPGQRFEYSNSNFDVLGALLERHYDKPFEDIVRTQIFEPLGMSNSFVVTPDTEAQRPSGRYRYWAIWPRPYKGQMGRRLVASGGAFSSTEDMSIFVNDLLSETPTLLSAESVERLFSLPGANIKEGYGLTWFIEDTVYGRLAIHDGSVAGATSLVGFFPEQDTGFVILSNSSIGMLSGNIRAIERGVVDILLDRPLQAGNSPALYVGLFYGVLALLIGLFIWLVRLLKSKANSEVKRVNKLRHLFRDSLISLCLVGLAYVALFYAPGAFQSSLLSLAEFLPDMGLMLGLAGGLSLTLAVVRPVIKWRSRKARV